MKRIKYIFLISLCFITFITSVYAANFYISATSYSMTEGNSITITINSKGMAGKYGISVSNSQVITVSNTSMWLDDNTGNITVKGLKPGSSVITVTPIDVTSYSGESITTSQSKTITVNKKATVTTNNNSNSNNNDSSVTQKPKSSNNLLESITIDGLELDKAFDKQVTEYEVTTPPGTEKIVVNAQLSDSTAKVVGTGEIKVSEGLNQLVLEVTAENGSKKEYKLKVTVKEYEPIIVNIDNDEYTVVRKYKDLPKISEYFEKKEIMIKDTLVDGYYSELLKYKVIGLKDKNGNINLYVLKNDEFILYQECVFNGKTLYLTNKELIGDYKKTTFLYDGEKIKSYQNIKLDILKDTYAIDNNDIEGNQFYLFYAINMETGQEELYQYDDEEKTVQRYNSQVIDMYKDRSDKYYNLFLVSIFTLGIVIILFSIILLIMKKNKKSRFQLSETYISGNNIDNKLNDDINDEEPINDIENNSHNSDLEDKIDEIYNKKVNKKSNSSKKNKKKKKNR